MHNKHRVIEEHIPLVVEFAEKKTSNKLKKTQKQQQHHTSIIGFERLFKDYELLYCMFISNKALN